MSMALVQLFLCLAAGYLLWRLWRSFAAQDAWTRGIVFVGFFGRAAAGVALFWISHLRLPFLRSLQLGDGLWFFATDATYYMPTASAAARAGLSAIIGVSRGASSVAYVQVLALFGLLFGIVASVALLLNLFCYLGSCAAIVKLRNATPAGRVPGTVALAAISFSPTAVLWSVQPLKDTLFQFLIVAFIAACAMWQRSWRTRPSIAMLGGSVVILLSTLYAISGIRWYFAVAALAAVLAFFVLVAAAVPRKMAAMAAGLIVFVMLTQAFLRGAGVYTPPRIIAMLSFSTPLKTRVAALAPSAFVGDLHSVRSNFDRAGGDTSIGVGTALTGERESARSASVPAGTAAAPAGGGVQPAGRSARPSEGAATDQARTLRSPARAAHEPTSHAPVAAAIADASQSKADVGAKAPPQTEIAAAAAPSAARTVPAPSDSHSRTNASPAPIRAPRAADAAPAPSDAHSRANASPAPIRAAHAADAVSASGAPQAARRPEAAPPTGVSTPPQSASPAAAETPRGEPARSASAAPAPPPSSVALLEADDSAAATTTASGGATREGPEQPSTRSHRTESGATRPDGAALDQKAPSLGKAEPAAQPPLPAPEGSVATNKGASPPPSLSPLAPQPAAPPVVVLPQSTAGRVVTGTIAVFVPRSLADRFNLIEIGGGKGLLWFTDLDTLAFDIIVLFGLVYLARRLRWATFRNPTFWLVILIGVLVGVPLAYAITNFGTLFRLRMMLYTVAALMPLVLALAATHREVIMSEAGSLVRGEDAHDAMRQPTAS